MKAIWPGNHVTLCAISVGDHAARWLEDLSSDRELEIYTINPCPVRKALRPGLRELLLVGAPLFELLCHLLGWLSVLPMIPALGGRYSLILLADQYMTLAYDQPPKNTSNTQGVILSLNDELLDNNFLEEFFQNNETVRIPTKHGDTVGMDFEYLKGVRKLLEL